MSVIALHQKKVKKTKRGNVFYHVYKCFFFILAIKKAFFNVFFKFYS